jgi:hypothetical protein
MKNLILKEIFFFLILPNKLKGYNLPRKNNQNKVKALYIQVPNKEFYL